MAINVSASDSGGFPPDIILLTLCYYRRGTRLDAINIFCSYSLSSHLNVLTHPPPDWVGVQKDRCVQILFKHMLLWFRSGKRENVYICEVQPSVDEV